MTRLAFESLSLGEVAPVLNRDSIRFQVVLVTASIITLLMCLLLGFQLYHALALGTEVQRTSMRTLAALSEEQGRVLLERLEADIHFDIDMLALTVSRELYDMNDESLEDKARKFIGHPAICSVAILDTQTSRTAVRIGRPERTGCVARSLPILHGGETIGRLDVEYSLAPLRLIAERARERLADASQGLQDGIDAATRRSMMIQILIYGIALLLLLHLITRRINRTIVKPIYALMSDMRRLNQDESAKLHLRDGLYGNDELGRLSHYFYDHIATLINQLNKRANHDDLTALLSRQRLIYDIARSQSFELAVFDIDRFKEINNLLGIGAGDELLRSTADLLTAVFARGACSIYRLNADEFALLDRFAPDPETFEVRTRAFVDRFNKREIILSVQPISVSISAGIASHKDPSPLVAATTALKFAKERKVAVVRFDRDLPILREYEHNVRMARVIRAAIEQDLVFPLFQPIEDLGLASVNKYEALMRLRDEDGRVYVPGEFLEIAKKSGAYLELSASLIRKAAAFLHDGDSLLSVNLSVLDIESAHLVHLLDHLYRAGGMTERMIFEITEQERMDSSGALMDFIAQAKGYGARIAMDDFGSGYSNFETLIHLDLDFLKIDGSLIRNIITDPSAEAVVETIIAFAKRLHIQTIAEYVANEAIYKKIKAMGVDFAQGDFVGRPAPSGAIEGVLGTA